MIGRAFLRGRAGPAVALALACTGMTGCETPVRDPTIVRLDAEVRLLKAAHRPVSHPCLAALDELTQTVKTMQAERFSDTKDLVAADVLESDQRAADRLCHPEVAALCEAPTGEAVAACETLRRVHEPYIY